jgi:thiosulfate reductase/polysulfide reductase chain A
MFLCNPSLTTRDANPAYLTQALSALELGVVIDTQMSEVGRLAHYIVPDTSYLERLELPELSAGIAPSVCLRDQVLPRIHENTRPIDQIFTELAHACGVGAYFTFGVEELADAQLGTLGLNLTGLKKVGSAQIAKVTEPFAYGKLPTLTTPSGKIQFTSEACVAAGYPASPTWLKPHVLPKADSLRLIGGEQAAWLGATADIPDLTHINERYHLTLPWISARVAAGLDIADGDEVELIFEGHTARARIHITEGLNPTALFLPGHGGGASGASGGDSASGASSGGEAQLRGDGGAGGGSNSGGGTGGNDDGLLHRGSASFQIEPGYGSALTQETLVTVKKAGA